MWGDTILATLVYSRSICSVILILILRGRCLQPL
jgi:hypothetical protein